MTRTYKRKLKPTKEQAQRMASWIGACRVVYNLGLEIKITTWKSQRRSISAYELSKQLPELKQDYPWIRDVPAQSLQAVLERLERSYHTFFKGGGFPKWATKKKYRSIYLKSLKVLDHSVILPKIGAIRMFRDAPIEGVPKTAQLVLDPTGLFICIQCEVPDSKPVSENQAAVGIDMGLAHFCVLSDGTLVENPQHFKKHERKLRIVNRSLARKKKGSNSWKKQARRLARLHHTIGGVRRDFLHKTSTQIARQYSKVYVEDLNIRGMVRNHLLSKHILDAGWGLFVRMLSSKTEVIKVDPKHTSQRCHRCGVVDAESRTSRSQFVCTSCGHITHADVNAAKVIMSRGAALVRQREAVACA